MGAGVTGQPATVYSSSANPALTDAGNPTGGLPSAAPAMPATPAVAPALGAGMGGNMPSNPFAAMLAKLGYGGL